MILTNKSSKFSGGFAPRPPTGLCPVPAGGLTDPQLIFPRSRFALAVCPNWPLDTPLLVYLTWRYIKYLISAVSRTCANGYFMITNQSYISWSFTKSGLMKKLFRHFQHFRYSNINMTYVRSFMKKPPFCRNVFKLLAKFYYVTNCSSNVPTKMSGKKY